MNTVEHQGKNHRRILLHLLRRLVVPGRLRDVVCVDHVDDEMDSFENFILLAMVVDECRGFKKSCDGYNSEEGSIGSALTRISWSATRQRTGRESSPERMKRTDLFSSSLSFSIFVTLC